MLSDNRRAEASIERVLAVLDSEAAKVPGTATGEMFSDWALLLRGDPLPWHVPWVVGA